jgi:hypothetical protein
MKRRLDKIVELIKCIRKIFYILQIQQMVFSYTQLLCDKVNLRNF